MIARWNRRCDVWVDYSLPACKDITMAWTTPTLVEICIGLEINGYLPAEL
jgi:coenzyme PQQ precursor peptide PqqA